MDILAAALQLTEFYNVNATHIKVWTFVYFHVKASSVSPWKVSSLVLLIKQFNGAQIVQKMLELKPFYVFLWESRLILTFKSEFCKPWGPECGQRACKCIKSASRVQKYQLSSIFIIGLFSDSDRRDGDGERGDSMLPNLVAKKKKV